jgi:hypothetical protein
MREIVLLAFFEYFLVMNPRREYHAGLVLFPRRHCLERVYSLTCLLGEGDVSPSKKEATFGRSNQYFHN